MHFFFVAIVLVSKIKNVHILREEKVSGNKKKKHNGMNKYYYSLTSIKIENDTHLSSK